MKDFNQQFAKAIRNQTIQVETTPKFTFTPKFSTTGKIKFYSNGDNATGYDPIYSASIADAEGVIAPRLDLRGVDLSKMEEYVKSATHGKLVDGYRVVCATPATKDRILVALDEKSIAKFGFDTWFGIKDVIRLSPIFTPCDHLMTRTSIRIMFVEDFTYGTGDGMAVANRNSYAMNQILELSTIKVPGKPESILVDALKYFLETDSESPQEQQLQFRSMVSERKAILKGTFIQGDVSIYRDDPFEIDMVIPMSCVKGGDFKPGEVYIANNVPFGIVEGAEERKASVGYQVTGTWPEEVWNALEKQDEIKINFLRQMLRDPETFTRTVKLVADVSPQYADLLAMIATFCVEVGDNSLMFSDLVSELIEDFASTLNTAMCVSGITKATSLMLIQDINVEKDVLIVNPKSKLFEGWKWAFRNPFVKLSDGRAVRLVKHERCPEGSVIAHPDTMKAGGADADGDFINIIEPTEAAPHVQVLIDKTKGLAPEGNGRAEAGNPPATLEEALMEIMQVRIGPVANAKDDVDNFLWMLRQKWAGASTIEKAQILQLADRAKTLRLDLGVELQKRVDLQKRFPVINKELVKDTRKWLTEQGFEEKDRVHRMFANGTIKGWKRWDRTKEETSERLGGDFAALQYGRVVKPSNFVGKSCRIALRFGNLDLPTVTWQRVHQGVYQNWIAERNHPEAIALADDSYAMVTKLLNEEIDGEGEETTSPMSIAKLRVRSLMTTLEGEALDAFVSRWWHTSCKRNTKSGWLIMGDEFVRLLKADYGKPRIATQEAIVIGLHYVAKMIPGTNDYQTVLVSIAPEGYSDASGRKCQAVHIQGVKGTWKIEGGTLDFLGQAEAVIVGMKKQDGTPAKRSQLRILGSKH